MCVRGGKCFLLPSDHISVGGFKNAASSREQRLKVVRVRVHIDFPTRLFTAKVKLWLERKGEQAKRRETDERTLHLDQWWGCQKTQIRRERDAQTHTCKRLFSCFVLFSFYSRKQYPMTQKQHIPNIPNGKLGKLYHACTDEDACINKPSDRLLLKQQQRLLNRRPPNTIRSPTHLKKKKETTLLAGLEIG